MTEIDMRPRTSAVALRNRKEASPGAAARRRFRRNALAVGGVAVIAVVLIAVIAAPWLTPYTPEQIDLGAVRRPPSPEHLLGTDSVGRDVLTRLLHGGRVSLAVGLCAAVIAVTVGTIVGVVAGWAGGWVDTAITRIIDGFLVLPAVLVAIVLAGVLGPNIGMLIGVIAGLSWPSSARIARSVVIGLRGEEFMQAAQVLGSRTLFVMRRHLVPFVLPHVTVAATLLVSEAILLEAALSFLGVGVQPPTPSWGNMLTEAQSITVLSSMPWLWIPTGLTIALTVLAAMVIGDGLRDALDPRKAR
ncbi:MULTISPECIES: ABC transporter permease [Microbacterium]|uniref:ABC transporter permease n=1 Tax=Microbacterium paraoxydans TaxID=199592 RepID=A0ABS5IM89_9MICO|nr:ABC transporter permease [Microbacterium paraoxydans]MBS0024078.1 ABC transporter permease [Microbacterium paraoxydans]